jgi:hypothetical protein
VLRLKFTAILSLWALLQLGGIAYSAPFADFPDRLYLTLARDPRLPLPTDPFTRDGRVPLHSGIQYNDAVFRSLISSASEIGSELAEVDTSIYVAWLVQALAVSTHESHWAHFRMLRPLGDRCQENLNSGVRHQEKSPRLGELFQKYLRPISGSCQDFRKDRPSLQLVASSDLESVGIFQIALRWHLAEYVDTGDFLNVERSIHYGLRYLYKGFSALVRNSDRFPCLSEHELESEAFRRALVRGTWAGHFNSGQVSKACRFTNAQSPWVKNDQNFVRSLNDLLEKRDLPSLSPEFEEVRSEVIRWFREGVEPDSETLRKIRSL